MVKDAAVARCHIQNAAIVSHPRSGLSWLRNMLWEYRKRAWSRSIRKDWTEPKHPVIPFFHDGIGMASTLKNGLGEKIGKRKRDWSKPHDRFDHLIFLARHPLDIMVSNYTRLRLHGRFKRYTTLDKFMRDPNLGLLVLLRWWASWAPEVEKRRALIVRYEKTRSFPFDALRDVLSHVGIDDINIESTLATLLACSR